MANPVHFGWFQTNGYSVQGWRDPLYDPALDWRSAEPYVESARYLESQHFDLIVVEDSLVIPDDFEGSARALLASARFAPRQDPWSYAPIVLNGTRSIGLAPVLSAGFVPPYLAARQLTTLNDLSRGRLGFNLVTSGNDRVAQNFGAERQVPHDERYDRADEWLQVLRKLWGSWADDAIVADVASGVFADAERVRPIDHSGEFYRVRGPLNAAPSVYGDPVIVQAGASPRGRRFAGEHAEVVVALPGAPEKLRAFRDSVRASALAAGRDPDHVKVLFVTTPVVAADRDEAERLRAERLRVSDERVEQELATYSFMAGTDLTAFAFDEPLPPISVESDQGSFDSFRSLAPEGATLRQIVEEHVRRDPRYVVGTPEELADHYEELAEAVGGDGFLFTGRPFLGNLRRTLDTLAPVLRARGLLRSEYGGDLLRQNLRDF